MYEILLETMFYGFCAKVWPCHVVNFEFTDLVKIQNLQHSFHVVNFVFTPTQKIQNLQHDSYISHKVEMHLKKKNSLYPMA